MTTTPFFSYKTVFLFLLLTTGLSFLSPTLVAQTVYTVSAGKAAKVAVSGTSDLQDWTISASQVASEGRFTFNENNELTSIGSFTMKVKASSLKGGVSAINRKAQKALGAKKHPYILFTLHKAVVAPGQNNKYPIKGTGALTINGITQTISVELQAVVLPDRSITLAGTQQLLFSDFLMQVPRFMGGVMQAGNQISVEFTLPFAPVVSPLASLD